VFADHVALVAEKASFGSSRVQRWFDSRRVGGLPIF